MHLLQPQDLALHVSQAQVGPEPGTPSPVTGHVQPGAGFGAASRTAGQFPAQAESLALGAQARSAEASRLSPIKMTRDRLPLVRHARQLTAIALAVSLEEFAIILDLRRLRPVPV